MNKEKKLLEELILALNHIGLNWEHIVEDYLDHKKEKEQKPVEELSEININIIDFQKRYPLEFLH